MFKRLIFLVNTLILFILLFLISVNIWFIEKAPQPAIVIAIEDEVVNFEAELAAQETNTQAELARTVQALQKQHTEYEAKRADLNAQIAARQRELVELQLKKQDLFLQLAKLETAWAERQAAHQNQLQLIQSQYDTRLTSLQSQLAEIQTKLSLIQP